MDFDIFASNDEPEDGLGADLDHSERVSCPHCGESCELPVDLVGGSSQEHVHDCEVCCRPWLVRVRLDGEGYASVSVTTLDNE